MFYNNHEHVRTIRSTTPFSSNSGGTLMPCAIAARIYQESQEISVSVRKYRSGPTVSMTPDALGLPSMRIGLPPIYLETRLSNGSNVWLYAEAAADGGRDMWIWY